MKGKERNTAFFSNQKPKGSASLQSRFKAARAQGTLNMSSSVPPMTSIPMEVFDLEKCIEEGEKFWEFEPLKSLDMSFNKIAFIPDEVCSLVDCTSMKFRDNVIEQIPDGLYEGCISLKHLDFGSNRISNLSGRIANLAYLKDLLLSTNQLTAVPPELMDCQSIVTLELDHNKLRALPDHRWRMSCLVSLNVSHNALSSLPACLADVLTLEVLNCGSNSIARLPDLSRLTALRILDASQNVLEGFPSLPRENSKNKLSHLILGYNRISSIDIEVLSHHKTLSELLLHNNRLDEVPAEIEYVGSLKIIDVSNNNLRDLPATLGYMSQLQHIRAEGNPIKVIRQHILVKSTNDLKAHLRSRGPSLLEAAPIEETPRFTPHMKAAGGGSPMASAASASAPYDTSSSASVGAAPSRRDPHAAAGKRAPNSATIAAAHAQLADRIDFRIRDITGTTLDMSSLALTALPEDFAEQVLTVPLGPTLVTLNLTGNALSTLPIELQGLPALRVLNVASNKLSTGREVVSTANLPHLTSVDLSKNDLSKEALQALLCATSTPRSCNLTEIVANNNPLRDIPAELIWHRGLKTLRLCYCQLTSLEALDFTALPALQNLDVSNNKIVALPVSLYSSHCLEYLSVENNELREIAVELGGLPRLKVLLIAGNPQRTVRTNILQQGSSKVIEWLRSRIPVGSAPAIAAPPVAPLPSTGNNAHTAAASGDTWGAAHARQDARRAVESYEQFPEPAQHAPLPSRRRVPTEPPPNFAHRPPAPAERVERADYAAARAEMQYATESSAYRTYERDAYMPERAAGPFQQQVVTSRRPPESGFGSRPTSGVSAGGLSAVSGRDPRADAAAFQSAPAARYGRSGYNANSGGSGVGSLLGGQSDGYQQGGHQPGGAGRRAMDAPPQQSIVRRTNGPY